MTEVHAAAPEGRIGRQQSEQIREQVREQVRVQVQQAREAVQRQREAAQQQREAIQAEREAEQVAREAEQAAREALGDVRVIHVPPAPAPPGRPQDPIILHPPRGPWDEHRIPGEVVDIVGMLTFGTAAVLILRPLMRAFANRFERRGAPPAALPPEVTAQMQRLEQAIEAVAIEVERISEGQRYTTKLLAERAGKSGSGVG